MTEKLNWLLIGTAIVFVALVGVVAYGWHQTTAGLGRDLVCENPHLVNQLRLEPCGDYGIYVEQTGDYPPGAKK